LTPSQPAFLVGFAAEARVARLSGWQVVIGGGTTAGAARTARRLIEGGATGIVSFGLAGGLDPMMRAGTLIVAEAVAVDGHVLRTDQALNARLGGTTGHLCLGWNRAVASPEEKWRLSQETGASSVDMESGAVAQVAFAAGVPFAVMRAICDPAHRTVPHAALVALNAAGGLAVIPMAISILARPSQIGALWELARDAAVARRALRERAVSMSPHAMPSKRHLPDGILDQDLVPDGIL
jgi:adenosylhomocysteine nucleosidase